MGHLAQASAWSNLIAEWLLPFYSSAVKNGWKEEAPTCARRLVQEHNARDLAMFYHPKMETAGSLPYRRLLAYARPAVTRIRGLPVRRCSAWCCCRIRYPATLSTASPPEWLTAHFEAAQDALRDRPRRSQLLQDRPVKSSFVISFEASVIADRPPCTQLQGNKSKAKSKSGPFDGKIPTLWQCTADDNVIWAGAVLWHYAVAVDRAVEHVRLHSSILGFLRCPYFMTIFRLTSPLHNG